MGPRLVSRGKMFTLLYNTTNTILLQWGRNPPNGWIAECRVRQCTRRRTTIATPDPNGKNPEGGKAWADDKRHLRLGRAAWPESVHAQDQILLRGHQRLLLRQAIVHRNRFPKRFASKTPLTRFTTNTILNQYTGRESKDIRIAAPLSSLATNSSEVSLVAMHSATRGREGTCVPGRCRLKSNSRR